MIVGSGQFSDGYGNARVHKYSPTARRGSACRPATPTSSPGRDPFDVSLIATGGPALSAEKDIACGVPLRVPLDFIP
jgi:hypothetical protein